jgi:hypothetical protein
MSKAREVKKSWTFMVYMAGDNNLDPDGVRDLKEMKKVGSTNDVNVIVQYPTRLVPYTRSAHSQTGYR